MKGIKGHNKKLLVEGKDDQHVIWSLCEKFQVAENFDVIDCVGIDNLYEKVDGFIKQNVLETIGIIIDADSDIQKRWLKLLGILQEGGYKIPESTYNQAIIISQDDLPKIGIWIMPDNKINGMLEDFITFLIPKDDELLPIANQVLEQIEQKNINKYNLIHHSKALIHTWLAWQDDPGTPMGLSITKRYLTTEEELCNQFIDWLKKLFN